MRGRESQQCRVGIARVTRPPDRRPVPDAIKRLIEAHREEFQQLLAEELSNKKEKDPLSDWAGDLFVGCGGDTTVLGRLLSSTHQNWEQRFAP